MKYAFVFPGQGSQFVGMGKELAETFKPAKEVFQEVNDALSQDLFKIMCEGPESELTLTANAQPALMAHSMAVVRVLEKEFGIKLKDRAAFVAGHSLGEYSAACAAGVFSLADTAVCCVFAVKRCSRRFRSDWAEWLPFWAFLSKMSRLWPRLAPRAETFAWPPMTMPTGRWC